MFTFTYTVNSQQVTYNQLASHYIGPADCLAWVRLNEIQFVKGDN